MINILMPLDFSPCSLNALNFAAQMARALDGKLFLLHVIEPMGGDATMFIDEQMIEDEVNQANKRMDRVIDTIAKSGYVKHDGLILTGFPIEKILELVEEKQISLIVMGTEGTQNKFQDLLGSNTYNVIRKANCAVLVIPTGATNINFKKIGLAADLHKKENIYMLTLLKHIAKYFDSEIFFLHVSKDKDVKMQTDVNPEAVLWLTQQFEGYNHSFINLPSGDIARTLDDYTKKNKIDLIVVSPEKHSPLNSLFKTSTTRQLVLHSKLPVLTMPADY